MNAHIPTELYPLPAAQPQDFFSAIMRNLGAIYAQAVASGDATMRHRALRAIADLRVARRAA